MVTEGERMVFLNGLPFTQTVMPDPFRGSIHQRYICICSGLIFSADAGVFFAMPCQAISTHIINYVRLRAIVFLNLRRHSGAKGQKMVTDFLLQDILAHIGLTRRHRYHRDIPWLDGMSTVDVVSYCIDESNQLKYDYVYHDYDVMVIALRLSFPI